MNFRSNYKRMIADKHRIGNVTSDKRWMQGMGGRQGTVLIHIKKMGAPDGTPDDEVKKS
jgi:hypothetical protein